RVHHRAQLQALPHARIPAHPTLLVLRSCTSYRLRSLDSGAALVCSLWLASARAQVPILSDLLVLAVMGDVLSALLLHFKIKASWLYPPCHAPHRSPSS